MGRLAEGAAGLGNAIASNGSEDSISSTRRRESCCGKAWLPPMPRPQNRENRVHTKLSAFKRYRPRILNFLSLGAGGTVGIAVAYFFIPSLFNSPEDMQPGEWLVMWWLLCAFWTVSLSAFRIFMPKQDKER